MKKIFLYSISLCLLSLGLASCNDDEDQLTDTKVTYYVDLELQGEESVAVPVGTSYTDAGCKATENGEDVTANIKTTGLSNIDVNKVGLYTIVYSVANADGFVASTSRSVVVYDPSVTTDISGTWKVQDGSYRLYNGNKAGYDGFTVTVTKFQSGIFYVSDYLAGWYDQRAGYGRNYACYGYMQLTADNQLVCLSSRVNGWGDSLSDFEGSYDPATETITWDATYTDYPFVFHAILKK